MDLLQLNTEEEFIDYWRKNLRGIVYNADEFASNQDHGLPHSFRVWQKARETMADIHEPIREGIVCLGCVFHDCGRNNPAEQELQNHHLLGIRYFARYAERERISSSNWIILSDIILSHDYFNERISSGRLCPPQSIEGEIVRAADKTSLDPSSEVDRYWAYGKRKGEAFYKAWDNLDNEIVFRSDWTPAQYTDERTDQLCWLSIIFEKQRFNHPVIQRHYDKWSEKKQSAVDRILELAGDECPQYIEHIKDLIKI